MNALKIYRDAEWALEHNKITIGEFEERIEPLKDVVCVVRCKDCKHGNVNPCSEFTTCFHEGSCLYGNTRKSDWFCADGEPREDDDGE